MDNFEVLNHYSIPSDVLMDMLDTYRLLGMNNEYLKKIGDRESYMFKETIEKDTYYACRLLNIDVSDNRLRLLITKNSVPKNKQEEVVSGIKKVFLMLHENAKKNFDYNGSDILDNLNFIFGKRSVQFSKDTITHKGNHPITVRLYHENVLEKYHNYRNLKKFEPIFLSVVCYMEIANLKPYTAHTDFGRILALYYMMLLSDVLVFKYVSFMEIYSKFKDEFEDSVKRGSINYLDNYLQTTDSVRIVFKMIKEAYGILEKQIKEFYYADRAYKSDVIEDTILKKMPEYFTKDDIRRLHQNASDSTINRILFKLRDQGIIMPLGTGRSARWMRLVSANDPKILFGVDYEDVD